jgi:hypothetical protein
MQAMGDTILFKIIMAMNPRQHIITIPITLIRMATITIRGLKVMWASQDTRAMDTGEADSRGVDTKGVAVLGATVLSATGNNGFFQNAYCLSSENVMLEVFKQA